MTRKNLFSKIIPIVLSATIMMPNFVYADNCEGKTLSDEASVMDLKEKGLEGVNEIIVKYKNANKGYEKSFNLPPLKQKTKFEKLEMDVLEAKDTESMETAITELKKDPNILYAEPNYIHSLCYTPTDPMTNLQWAVSNTGQELGLSAGTYGVDMNLPKAWNITRGSNDVVIGVIDTGIDITHPDLNDNIFVNQNEIPDNGIDDDSNGYVDDVNGYDFYNNDSSVFDPTHRDSNNKYEDFHGTHVAGIIAAESNDIGITGVAPNVRILPLKVGEASKGLPASDIIEAISYASSMGIKYINCSFGQYAFIQAEEDAMRESGIMFICSAGNDTINTQYNAHYPSCFNIPNIISVTGIMNNGDLLFNFGNNIDVAAPGASILSTYPNNEYMEMDGTSMATPYVTGLVALLASSNPMMTNAEIKSRVCQNGVIADNLIDKTANSRFIDAFAALNPIQNMSVKAVSTDNSIILTWEPVGEATSYEVEYDGKVISLDTNTLTYTIDNLKAGSKKVVSVRAKKDTADIAEERLLKVLPKVGTGVGLTAEYFDNADFTGSHKIKTDSNIDFDWGIEAPLSTMDKDNYSVRWVGEIEPKYTERYTFSALVSGGIRVWINGELKLDKYSQDVEQEFKFHTQLKENKKYYIRIEYYKNSGNGKINLSWSTDYSLSKTTVKSESLYPYEGKGMWISKGNSPEAIASCVTAVVNDKIYSMGGEFVPSAYSENKYLISDKVYEYDPLNVSWISKKSMMFPRKNFATATVNGKIYVIGGRKCYESDSDIVLEKFSKSVEEYDPSTDTWVKKCDMITGRERHTVVAVNGKIYAIGGVIHDDANDTNIVTNTVEEYDPVTDTWETKKSMNLARYGLGGTELNGKIYISSGNNGTSDIFSVEVYDPSQDSWTYAADIKNPRRDFGCVTFNNKIYAVGGISNGSISNSVEEYDADSDKWVTVKSYTDARRCFSTAAAAGKIVVMSGCTLFADPIYTIEEYIPNNQIMTSAPNQDITSMTALGVAGGSKNSFVIKEDGTVSGWGLYSDVPSELKDVVAVSSKAGHQLALKRDGTVVAWGNRYTSGQLQLPSGLSDIKAVASGYKHDLALKNDGTVIAWGDNTYGQCNVPAELNNVIAISAGCDFNLALKSDGTVVAWGDNDKGSCNVPSGLKDVKAITAGELHAIALKNDGTVVEWGAYFFEGESTFVSRPSNLSDIVQISAGNWHVSALKADGTVISWGDNFYGQCNIPSSINNNITYISSGLDHILAITKEGKVIGWGNNGNQQLEVPDELKKE